MEHCLGIRGRSWIGLVGRVGEERRSLRREQSICEHNGVGLSGKNVSRVMRRSSCLPLPVYSPLVHSSTCLCASYPQSTAPRPSSLPARGCPVPMLPQATTRDESPCFCPFPCQWLSLVCGASHFFGFIFIHVVHNYLLSILCPAFFPTSYFRLRVVSLRRSIIPKLLFVVWE